MNEASFNPQEFNADFAIGVSEQPTDLITAIVEAYQSNPAAAPIRDLLADENGEKLCADFDPENVSRPYVLVSQNNLTNAYYSQGFSGRVDKVIIQFLIFTDTRKQCVDLLNALDDCYSSLSLSPALGRPQIVDKVAQLDRLYVDAWKGTINLLYFCEKSY